MAGVFGCVKKKNKKKEKKLLTLLCRWYSIWVIEIAAAVLKRRARESDLVERLELWF